MILLLGLVSPQVDGTPARAEWSWTLLEQAARILVEASAEAAEARGALSAELEGVRQKLAEGLEAEGAAREALAAQLTSGPGEDAVGSAAAARIDAVEAPPPRWIPLGSPVSQP